MDLRWCPVAVVGLACLAVAIALALLTPMEQVRRQLRPLANTSRLTRLPEYARVARARMLSTIVAIVLLVGLFLAALLASARPAGWWSALGAPEAPEDIMLCVGEPVTSPATGEFLTYFAEQATTYGTQRIGLTSPNRRVVPLTRDYQYAAGTFGDFAEASGAGATRAAAFSPPVTYVDYARSVADVLALCITGFPSFEVKDSRRRALIYLGPSELRAPGETRPSLFTDQQLIDMAGKAGVQVNVVASSAPATGALQSITESTGGQYVRLDGGDAGLASYLDAIRDNPPQSALPATATRSDWFGDSPTIPLVVAVVATALLCVSLVVLRR
ncbi:hypothetical protein [Mycobacterium hubeiense]|uniref:hypothetical protein n=1 Tax=Mycobacterium hubeiense TaxID=1867256 RepID=UPI000C7F6DB9|nr:hypothetical protein [Mycobacterium sp. QGD 101]